MEFDAETCFWVLGVWGILSGIFAFWNCEKFLLGWFEIFSGMVGIWAIMFLVLYSASTYTNAFLAAFWSILLIVGVWRMVARSEEETAQSLVRPVEVEWVEQRDGLRCHSAFDGLDAGDCITRRGMAENSPDRCAIRDFAGFMGIGKDFGVQELMSGFWHYCMRR